MLYISPLSLPAGFCYVNELFWWPSSLHSGYFDAAGFLGIFHPEWRLKGRMPPMCFVLSFFQFLILDLHTFVALLEFTSFWWPTKEIELEWLSYLLKALCCARRRTGWQDYYLILILIPIFLFFFSSTLWYLSCLNRFCSLHVSLLLNKHTR